MNDLSPLERKFKEITATVLDLSNWVRKRQAKELPNQSLEQAIKLLNEYSIAIQNSLSRTKNSL